MKKKYEKIIALILCASMILSGSVFVFADETAVAQDQETVLADEATEDVAVLETAGERVDGDITVHYPPSLSTELDTTVTVKYSDDFFSTDNTKYDKSLAKFLLAASMASYAYPVSYDAISETPRDKNIRNLLEKELKYTGYKSFKYDVELSNSDDTAGYAFAYKELDNGEKVMAIAIRSSGYGSEWASNLRVSGGNDEHKGFANTADAVYKDVKAYASANGITKIWITGYSRGAAVANVLAKRVADGNLVGAEDLYCYTFETPATTKKSIAVQGLFNVINSVDAVAQIPFYFWGYKRYGQDEFYIVNKASLKNYQKGMKSNKLSSLKNKLGGYTVPTQRGNDITMECISSIFGGNDNSFANNYEEKLQKIGDLYLGGEENLVPRKANQGQAIVDIMTSIGLHSYLKSKGVNSNAVFQQHTPEALLFWMDTIAPAASLQYKYITVSSGYKKCNIVVTDSKGKKVAEIKKGNYSNFIKKNSVYSLEVNKDENGNLMILIPVDDNYTVKITAMSATTIDYKVTNYNCSVKTRIADYKGIKLKKNGTILSKSSNNYATKVSKGKAGSTKIYNSTKVDVASVYATVTDGSTYMGLIQTSFVTGTGKYPDKYKVTLKVHNSEPGKYTLVGWYLNGKRISKTATCTVTTDASKVKNLVVKYKKNSY